MPKKLSGKEIGETTFMAVYLLFLLVVGIISYIDKNYLLVILVLFLGIGDSFHLIPRIIKNIKGDFKNSDFFLGLGSQISSITMTIFYLLLINAYDIFAVSYAPPPFNQKITLLSTIKQFMEGTVNLINFPKEYLIGSITVYLTLIRIILCLFPNNNWYKKEGNQVWAVIRNIPFVIIGLLAVVTVFKLEYIYLGILIILSFLFYIPVALFAKKNPKLGMLMIPKTICYILMIIYFL